MHNCHSDECNNELNECNEYQIRMKKIITIFFTNKTNTNLMNRIGIRYIRRRDVARNVSTLRK